MKLKQSHILTRKGLRQGGDFYERMHACEIINKGILT